MATIKIRRGDKTDIPSLEDSELGHCTDTDELFIGTSTGNVRVGAEILDEDTLVSDSDTSLATQQSTKAYVDSHSSLIQGSLIANGAITIGDPVSVDYNGDIEKTQVIAGTAVTNANKTSFSSVLSYRPKIVMLDSSRFVLSYVASDNSKGIAKIGTVTSGVITYGSEYEWESTIYPNYVDIVKIGTNKIVVSFYDATNTRITVRVGTISGNVITWGTAVSLTNSTSITALCDLGTDKFCLAYTNNTNSDIETIIATVSGTVPTFGTSVSTATTGPSYQYKIESLSTSKIVLVYEAGFSGSGRIRVATVSGTVPTFGTAVAYNTDPVQKLSVGVLNDSSLLIASDPSASSLPHEVYLMSVSGTVPTTEDSITITPSPNSINDIVVNIISDNRATISACNDPNYLIILLDIKDDTIIVNNLQTLETYDYRNFASSTACYFEGRNFIIAHGDKLDSYNGVSFIQEYAEDNRKDFIGISQDTVSDGEQVTVKSFGSIDYNQSGLAPAMPYFLDNTASLSTSETDGYKIGRSLSSSAILISENQEILDEDDMISDSDHFLCTQQSVKAYVDNNDNIAQFVQAGNNISIGDPVGVDSLNNVSKMSSESVIFEKTSAYTGGSVIHNTACRLSDTTFVVMWYDSTASKGYVIHATISSIDDITYGTAVQFATITSSPTFDICRLSDTSFALVWDEYVRVGTVSGTTITLGTTYTGGTNSATSRITGLSSIKFVVQFMEYTSDELVCIPCDVSGTTITAGTSKIIYDEDTANYTDVATIDATHILISYHDEIQRFVVGTVSLFDITLGTPVTVLDKIAYKTEILDSTHFVFMSYKAGADGDQRIGNTIGTISGNNISFSDTLNFFRNPNGVSVSSPNIAILSATKYINFWNSAHNYGNDDTYYNICNIANGDEITSEMVYQYDFLQQHNTLLGLTSTKPVYVTNHNASALSLITNKSLDFVGIAQEVNPSNYIRVKTSGQVDDNQSGLEIGEYYFINTLDGELTTYPTTQQVGRAIETDKIFIDARTLQPVKNMCINGNFSHWQRSTSSTASGFGSADRFRHDHLTTSKTVSRQWFTPGQTDVPNSPDFYLQHQITTGGTGTAHYAKLATSIINSRFCANRRLYVSFWANPGTTSKEVTLEVSQHFGTGGSATVEIPPKQIMLYKSAGWEHYIAYVDIPSVTGKALGSLHRTIVTLWMDAGTNYIDRAGYMSNGAWTCKLSNLEIYTATRPMPVIQRAEEEELTECMKYYHTGKVNLRWKGVLAGEWHEGNLSFPERMIQVPHTTTVGLSGVNCNIYLYNVYDGGSRITGQASVAGADCYTLNNVYTADADVI